MEFLCYFVSGCQRSIWIGSSCWWGLICDSSGSLESVFTDNITKLRRSIQILKATQYFRFFYLLCDVIYWVWSKNSYKSSFHCGPMNFHFSLSEILKLKVYPVHSQSHKKICSETYAPSKYIKTDKFRHETNNKNNFQNGGKN